MFGPNLIWPDAFRESGAFISSKLSLQNQGKPNFEPSVFVNSASIGAASPIPQLEGKTRHEIDFLRHVPDKRFNARAYPYSNPLDPTHYDVTYLLEAESILPADIAVSADNWPRGYALGSLLDYDPLQRSRSGIFSKKINSIGVFGTHPIFNDPAPLLESAGKSKIPPPSILGGKIPTIAMARGHLAYCRYLYNYCDPNYEDIPEKMVKDAAIYARKAWKTAAEAAEKAGEVCPSDLLDKLCRAIMHNQFGIRHVDDAAFIMECMQTMLASGSVLSGKPALVFAYWMVRDLKAILPHKRTSLPTILRLTNAVWEVMQFDKRFELMLSVCVHETVRRVSLSKAFSRSCGDDADVIDAAVPAVAGIMGIVMEKFCSDLKAIDSFKREILQKGPWKEPSVASWLSSIWQPGPYCAALDARPAAHMQLHYTEASGMIQKMAKFLSAHGPDAVSELSPRELRSAARGIFTSLHCVLGSECRWLAGDMAATLNELIRDVVEVATGNPAPEGDLLVALREVCRLRLS